MMVVGGRAQRELKWHEQGSWTEKVPLAQAVKEESAFCLVHGAVLYICHSLSFVVSCHISVQIKELWVYLLHVIFRGSYQSAMFYLIYNCGNLDDK